MSTFRIVPRVVERKVDRLVISRVNVILFNQAQVFVDMYGGDQILQQSTVMLTGEEYSQWASDDKYIIQLVAEKLGFALDVTTDAPSALDQGTAQTQ